jgi:uncharacterized protein
MKTTIITISCLTLNLLFCNGQSKKELELLKQKPPAKAKQENIEYAKKVGNEIDFVLSGLYLMYKSFISSQDISACSFYPSCSDYALEAIRKQGIIMGSINFFDRFCRCNGLNEEHYLKDYDKKLLIDPVKDIKYCTIHGKKH